MHPVGPHVDVVPIGQVRAMNAGARPATRSPAARSPRRQPGRVPEEARPAPVTKSSELNPCRCRRRQHLGDLRALAAVRRQDRPTGTGLLIARRVDPAVVHPWRPYRARAGATSPPLAPVAVPPDQAMAALIYLACVARRCRPQPLPRARRQASAGHPHRPARQESMTNSERPSSPPTTLNTAASLPRRGGGTPTTSSLLVKQEGTPRSHLGSPS